MFIYVVGVSMCHAQYPYKANHTISIQLCSCVLLLCWMDIEPGSSGRFESRLTRFCFSTFPATTTKKKRSIGRKNRDFCSTLCLLDELKSPNAFGFFFKYFAKGIFVEQNKSNNRLIRTKSHGQIFIFL